MLKPTFMLVWRGEYSSVVGVPIMAQRELGGDPQMVAAVMPRIHKEEAIAIADLIVKVLKGEVSAA